MFFAVAGAPNADTCSRKHKKLNYVTSLRGTNDAFVIFSMEIKNLSFHSAGAASLTVSGPRLLALMWQKARPAQRKSGNWVCENSKFQTRSLEEIVALPGMAD